MSTGKGIRLHSRKLAELGIAATLITTLVAGCGGGGGGVAPTPTPPSGFAQTYTSSAGVGEVLNLSVDTTKMTYSYTVIQSSYGIPLGKTSTGVLSGKSADGSYNVAASGDGFIQSGKIMPIQNGLLVGHVLANTLGGTAKIPVFGVSNPITTVAGLADTYNFEGFGCTAKSNGNVNGAPCSNHYGTIKSDSAGSATICMRGNLNAATPGCAATWTGTIAATGTPGVYDFAKAGTGHSAWIIAFTAPNNQRVLLIDHDDAAAPLYGHSVGATQVAITPGPVAAGGADGKYFVKDNLGGEWTITVSGTSYTSTLDARVGTFTYNTPWNGFVRVDLGPGTAMLSGTGAFTKVWDSPTNQFAIGTRY